MSGVGANKVKGLDWIGICSSILRLCLYTVDAIDPVTQRMGLDWSDYLESCDVEK